MNTQCRHRERTAGRRAGLALALVAVLSLGSSAWARFSGTPEGLPAGLSAAVPETYCLRPPNVFRQNVGLLDLAVTNLGFVGDPFNRGVCNACWKGNEYLYVGALWIGARASDNLTYVSTGEEGTGADVELRPSLKPEDTIYEHYEGCVNGNRPGFSADPDDDGDGLWDEDFPNGKDDDGDGKIDEDFAAISQQMLTCEYTDYQPEAIASLPQHRPLHVKIQQSSFAWSTEGANNFVGLDFTVFNEGVELLRDVYIGFFVDSDVGPRSNPNYYTDDGGAYWDSTFTYLDQSVSFECDDRSPLVRHRKCQETDLSLAICYMRDIPDNGTTANGGDADGFFGGMFLGHNTDPSGATAPKTVGIHTARFFSGSNAYPLGDPSNDTERYDLLQSGSKQTRPTTTPNDYRYVISTNKFPEFRPGQKIQFQVAFVIGSGFKGMLENAIAAQRIYNGKWRDLDNDRETGVLGKELCLYAVDPTDPVTWPDPCDSLRPTIKIVKDTRRPPAAGCIPKKHDCCPKDNWVDADCNCCTPLFGTSAEATLGGLETLVHWVGSVAPPPPGTNRGSQNPNFSVVAPAGDRKVVLAWDNLSELTADPIAQRILFTGYRIWRVEGWDRPAGSPGPSNTDWAPIADLSLNPADKLGKDSPYYLRKYRHDVDSIGPPQNTGSKIESEKVKWRYQVGRYSYEDTLGLKNGMLYFYAVTAYSAWDSTVIRIVHQDTTYSTLHFELAGRPSAVEADGVVPLWKSAPAGDLNSIYVVPNPYIKGQNPDGWDLTPSTADPTGTKIAFVGLPEGKSTIQIYTLAGDLVQTLDHQATGSEGTAFWNLISRNGQDIVSGVYLFSVQSGGKTKVGRFVVVR